MNLDRLSTMVIRPRSRTLEDLSLLSRSRAYTGGSCKMGVLCSFEMNDARRIERDLGIVRMGWVVLV